MCTCVDEGGTGSAGGSTAAAPSFAPVLPAAGHSLVVGTVQLELRVALLVWQVAL